MTTYEVMIKGRQLYVLNQHIITTGRDDNTYMDNMTLHTQGTHRFVFGKIDLSDHEDFKNTIAHLQTLTIEAQVIADPIDSNQSICNYQASNNNYYGEITLKDGTATAEEVELNLADTIGIFAGLLRDKGLEPLVVAVPHVQDIYDNAVKGLDNREARGIVETNINFTNMTQNVVDDMREVVSEDAKKMDREGVPEWMLEVFDVDNKHTKLDSIPGLVIAYVVAQEDINSGDVNPGIIDHQE